LGILDLGQNLVRNRNFWQRSQFLTKIEICDKKRNFWQRSTFLTKIEIFVKKRIFLQNSRNSGHMSKAYSYIRPWTVVLLDIFKQILISDQILDFKTNAQGLLCPNLFAANYAFCLKFRFFFVSTEISILRSYFKTLLTILANRVKFGIGIKTSEECPNDRYRSKNRSPNRSTEHPKLFWSFSWSIIFCLPDNG